MAGYYSFNLKRTKSTPKIQPLDVKSFIYKYLKVLRLEGWQEELLDYLTDQIKLNNFNGRDAVNPVKICVVSGHGIGKTALSCWILMWLLYRRSNTKGVITANTISQLRDKTWSELGKWLHIGGFNWKYLKGGISLYNEDNNSYCKGLTSKEDNSESFAGQHNRTSSSFYIFDEGSAIPNSIWDVAEGGLTDGEPFFLAFGNGTRNTGRFYDIVTERKDWKTFKVNSLDVSFVNKNLINDWKNIYGEKSDFYKVRVLGEFPSEANSQLISKDTIKRALTNKPIKTGVYTLGVDVARMGEDYTVLCSVKDNIIKVEAKLTCKDISQIQRFIVNMKDINEYQDIYVDDVGIGGGLVDYLKRDTKLPVTGVTASKPPKNKKTFLNLRSEINFKMAEFLKTAVLTRHPDLEKDLASLTYSFDNRFGLLKITSKDIISKDLGRSPDFSDALALNFYKIRKPKIKADIKFNTVWDSV